MNSQSLEDVKAGYTSQNTLHKETFEKIHIENQNLKTVGLSFQKTYDSLWSTNATVQRHRRSTNLKVLVNNLLTLLLLREYALLTNESTNKNNKSFFGDWERVDLFFFWEMQNTTSVWESQYRGRGSLIFTFL